MAILLSGMFCGDNHSFDFTPTDVPNINNIKIKNGIYDEVFATRNTNFEYSENNKVWDFYTILYPLFQSNLYAGNVSFTSDTVTAIRVKRRKKGTYTWDVIFEVPIYTNADFTFERFDRFARGNTEYEYSLVPVISGVEGNLNTNEIKSEFDGIYLVEKDVVYHCYLNTKIPETQRHQNSTIIETLGRKKPYVIKNGDLNYVSGSLNVTFIDKGLNCEYDIENGWKYREQVDDFLTNGRPKILKSDTGEMWLVSIVDSIPQDFSQHWQMPIHTIQWIEIGDCESTEDLFDADLIDVDPRLVR